ncbi:MAG: hypothetical protein ACRELZ_00025 [Candidatus Rokuibacteriota bacterium]
MLSGRGKFQKRRIVDGSLEISTSRPTDEARLHDWIHESRAVLPRLRAIVGNGRRPEPLDLVVEDLRRRVEELEQELARLRRELAGA